MEQPTNQPRRTCGAKTRGGYPCPTPSMPNGRCRMHGGKVGIGHGAPRGNKFAVKTGEHEAITLDTLTPEERALLDRINTDPTVMLDEQLRLLTIRVRRMLARVAQLRAIEAEIEALEAEVAAVQAERTALEAERDAILSARAS